MNLDEFYMYVYRYYGKNGIYDMGATIEQIISATVIRMRHKDIPFEGDTIDRERVCEIMIDKFGLVFPYNT